VAWAKRAFPGATAYNELHCETDQMSTEYLERLGSRSAAANIAEKLETVRALPGEARAISIALTVRCKREFGRDC
jgi:hypothetical protein